MQFSDPRCDAGTLSGPTGDADNDQRLDLSETWTYTCSHVVTAQSGDPVVNTVTVTGTDELGGNDTDTDTESVDVIRPDIEVVKSVDKPLAHVGDTLSYSFAVTNAGDTPLAVQFSDPRCDAGTLSGPTGDADNDQRLDLTETWTYTCSHVVTAQSGDPVVNTVTVTGTDELGGTDTDTDTESVDVIHPNIEVDKKLRRGDSGAFVDGPIQVHVGDTIQYRFEVTNEGDTPLAVEFSDPRCGAGTLTGPTGDANSDQRLDVAETWTYTCSHVVTAQSGDPVKNTVTVTGTDELGGKDEDKDSTEAEVVDLGIAVDKKLRRAEQGPFGEGPITVHVGDTIQYRFDVTNTGEAPLAVEFSDPRCDDDTVTGPEGDEDGDDRLDLDETWRYECTHLVTEESGDPIPNTVTVTGTDDLGGEVEDSDDETADVIHPDIEIDKQVDKQTVHVGDTLNYTFVVTNEGDTPLAVEFSDPRCDAGTLGRARRRAARRRRHVDVHVLARGHRERSEPAAEHGEGDRHGRARRQGRPTRTASRSTSSSRTRWW